MTDLSAPWIDSDQSFRSGACHTIISKRPAGRTPLPMLLKAAMGSRKNIVPNLLMT